MVLSTRSIIFPFTTNKSLVLLDESYIPEYGQSDVNFIQSLYSHFMLIMQNIVSNARLNYKKSWV